jgi:hypothetical protein
MTMNVTNNSRMTHRRILYELPLRLKDVPKIPQIVQDMQEMINEHEDIDSVQHRLVRWRSVGPYSANIFLSCYTHPTVDGIRLGTYCGVQQSILERCSQIIYKHAAQFASETDRYHAETDRLDGNGLTMLFDSFKSLTTGREEQLEAREQVLRQRERELKERERSVKAEAEKLAQTSANIKKVENKMQEVLVETQADQSRDLSTEDSPVADVRDGTTDFEGSQKVSSATAADSHVSEATAPDVQTPQVTTAVAAAAAAAELSQNDIAEHEELQSSAELVMPSATEAGSPIVGDEDVASNRHTAASVMILEEVLPELASDDVLEEVLDEAENLRIPVREMGD